MFQIQDITVPSPQFLANLRTSTRYSQPEDRKYLPVRQTQIEFKSVADLDSSRSTDSLGSMREAISTQYILK